MKDLSLVLCSFSLVLGSCSADSKFATFLSVFATMLQRYEEFLNYASFFRDYFSKNRKFLCFRNIFNISGHKSASKRLYRRISDHRAAGCNISGREPQLLSILSVSRLPVRSSFSLTVISCTRLWYVIPHFVLETFKYSFIQLGQEGF